MNTKHNQPGPLGPNERSISMKLITLLVAFAMLSIIAPAGIKTPQGAGR